MQANKKHRIYGFFPFAEAWVGIGLSNISCLQVIKHEIPFNIRLEDLITFAYTSEIYGISKNLCVCTLNLN